MAVSLDMSLPDPDSESGGVDWGSWLARVLPHVDLFAPNLEEILFMLDRPHYRRLSDPDEAASVPARAAGWASRGRLAGGDPEGRRRGGHVQRGGGRRDQRDSGLGNGPSPDAIRVGAAAPRPVAPGMDVERRARRVDGAERPPLILLPSAVTAEGVSCWITLRP